MKYIINVKPKERLSLNEIERKLKDARNSNDYILVNFGRKGEFIKMSFQKDQTYTIGFNFWNMEFQVKTNTMIRQYPKTVTGKLANWLTEWVNRLNR